jgi:hypothetical protein
MMCPCGPGVVLGDEGHKPGALMGAEGREAELLARQLTRRSVASGQPSPAWRPVRGYLRA